MPRAKVLIAATHDILLEPRWIESKANGLADALSRFNEGAIANLCPHWQNTLDAVRSRIQFCKNLIVGRLVT